MEVRHPDAVVIELDARERLEQMQGGRWSHKVEEDDEPLEGFPIQETAAHKCHPSELVEGIEEKRPDRNQGRAK